MIDAKQTANMIGNYPIGDLLGTGSTSDVYRSCLPGGQPVALKILHVNTSRQVQEAFFREADLLPSLEAAEQAMEDGRHSIPHIYEIGTKPLCFMVLDLALGVPLPNL